MAERAERLICSPWDQRHSALEHTQATCHSCGTTVAVSKGTPEHYGATPEAGGLPAGWEAWCEGCAYAQMSLSGHAVVAILPDSLLAEASAIIGIPPEEIRRRAMGRIAAAVTTEPAHD